MKARYPTPMWRWTLVALLLLILTALAVNWALLLQISQDAAHLPDEGTRVGGLPCAALPTRFVLGEPECAQKLLEAMNVTNVQVLSKRSRLSPPGDEMRSAGGAGGSG
ncbi:MAG: hypothetical protein JXO22_13490 [Phycisphaerae bacterium]|nr:hypothetical protein [Phycisphaerae bacterium]